MCALKCRANQRTASRFNLPSNDEMPCCGSECIRCSQALNSKGKEALDGICAAGEGGSRELRSLTAYFYPYGASFLDLLSATRYKT